MAGLFNPLDTGYLILFPTSKCFSMVVLHSSPTNSPLLKNRYQILQPLQAGGLGQTFLATDTQVPGNRRCVIKRLQPNININNPDIYEQSYALALKQFEKEAETLSRLKHDQIPALYDYFEDDSQLYLVQEWIEGHTLGELVRQRGSMGSEQVEAILLTLLPVLDYLQQKKVIHRDIKPDNIIVRESDGQSVLIDFGSVKYTLQTVLHQSGIPCSVTTISEGFSPPEQAAGRPINYSSDLYSLGMTAVYLLTGKLPQEMDSNVQTGQVLWQTCAPTVTPKLAAVIDKAIQFNPIDRYHSARDMQQALYGMVSFSSSTLPPTQISPVSSPPIAPAFAETPSGSINSELPRTILSTPPTFAPPLATPQTTQSKSKVITIAAGIAAVLVAGITGAYAYSSWDQHKQNQAAFEAVKDLQLEGNYAACQTEAQAILDGAKNNKKVATLWQQCRLDEAKQFAATDQYLAAIAKAEEIGSDSDFDTYQEAQSLISIWSGNSADSQGENPGVDNAEIDPASTEAAQARLKTAQEKRGAGDYRGAIAAALAVAPDSEVAPQAQQLVADLTHVKLGAKLDKELKPLNVSARSLRFLGGTMVSGPEKPVTTRFGESPIRNDRTTWTDYRQLNGSLSGGSNFSKYWHDTWLEVYDVVPGKMQTAVLYGCIANETVQTEVHFNAAVDRGFIQTTLATMLEGEFDSAVQQQLQTVHTTPGLSQVFETQTFKGLMQHTDQGQFRIILREV